MSRAFTKEDDAGAAALVPPRAPLPAGTPNYVTPSGFAALCAEHARLLQERAELERGEPDLGRARHAAVLARRILDLEARLGTAELVETRAETRDEVRFGATVTLRSAGGRERRVRIVGVDEANASEGLIAFVAPLARALLGKRSGEHASVHTPQGEDDVEILAVEYSEG